MKISRSIRSAMKWGVVTHALFMIPLLLLSYNTRNSEFGEPFFLLFFYLDTVPTLIIVLSIGLIWGLPLESVTPEPFKAIFVTILFIGGSCQWALIFAGIRGLWNRRKLTQGSRL